MPVWFPFYISVRGDSNRCILGERRWYYPENEIKGVYLQGRCYLIAYGD